MAAYRWIFRTKPPTINFTDPATVAAIQQVLDLATEEKDEKGQLRLSMNKHVKSERERFHSRNEIRAKEKGR